MLFFEILAAPFPAVTVMVIVTGHAAESGWRGVFLTLANGPDRLVVGCIPGEACMSFMSSYVGVGVGSTDDTQIRWVGLLYIAFEFC